VNGAPGPQGSQGPAGPAGTTGQSAASVFSTVPLLVTSGNTSFQQIPGLSKTLTVPANSVLLISSDGGGQATTHTAGALNSFFVILTVDGFLTPIGGGYTRVDMVNDASGTSAAIGRWAFTPMMIALSTGSHTIAVEAAGTGLGGSINVGGDVNSPLQGILTTVLLKQ
jgi:hypothetical protein